MATPPALSPEQRAAALAQAAEVRTARAAVKNRLKLGSITLAEALASTDETISKLKVVSLLESLPGVGKVKARKLMEEIGIADNRRVQGRGQQQSNRGARWAGRRTTLQKGVKAAHNPGVVATLQGLLRRP